MEWYDIESAGHPPWEMTCLQFFCVPQEASPPSWNAARSTIFSRSFSLGFGVDAGSGANGGGRGGGDPSLSHLFFRYLWIFLYRRLSRSTPKVPTFDKFFQNMVTRWWKSFLFLGIIRSPLWRRRAGYPPASRCTGSERCPSSRRLAPRA